MTEGRDFLAVIAKSSERDPNRQAAVTNTATIASLEYGVNWPRLLRTLVGDEVTEKARIGLYRINPKIDAKGFDVGR